MLHLHLQVQPDAVSTLLDPRYKSLFCQTPQKLASNTAKLRELLAEITAAAVPHPAPAAVAAEQQETDMVQVQAGHGHGQQDQGTSLWDSLDTLTTAASSRYVADDSISIDDELKSYLKEPPTGRDGNSLKWWKANKFRFPLLAKLARSLLAIPATSVNSERLNSTSGNIVTTKRCSLLSEHVEEMTFLNKNL